MRTLIIWGLIAWGGYQAWLKYGDELFQPAAVVDASGNPEVLLFVNKTCGSPCDDGARFLREQRVAFQQLDAHDNEARFSDLGGRNTVPFLAAGTHRVHGMNHGKYQAALAASVGAAAVSSAAWRALQKNFDSAGAPRVVMYSTTTCGYCTRTRKQFESAGVAYVEYFIDQDSRADDDFNALYGNGTPLIFNGYKRQTGYSSRTVSRLL